MVLFPPSFVLLVGSYFYESTAGLLHHLYHVLGLQSLLASERTTLADVQNFFRTRPTPDQQAALLVAERERQKQQLMQRVRACMHAYMHACMGGLACFPLSVCVSA